MKNKYVFYVLTNPQPIIPSTNEASEDEIDITCANKDWIVDDYKGCHLTLETPFDSLFNQFIKKTKFAKELWEVIIIVYKDEEIGVRNSMFITIENSRWLKENQF